MRFTRGSALGGKRLERKRGDLGYSAVGRVQYNIAVDDLELQHRPLGGFGLKRGGEGGG